MIVVLDACVLYPPSLRDLLLTLAALDAFDIRWSEQILDELTRNVIDDNPGMDPARFVQHTIARMRAAFPDAMTAIERDAIDKADNDPKDRHVAAVALTADAGAIVTTNVKDFRGRVLPNAGVAVLTPGALLDRILNEAGDVVVLAVTHLAQRWENPAVGGIARQQRGAARSDVLGIGAHGDHRCVGVPTVAERNASRPSTRSPTATEHPASRTADSRAAA